ncbi:hypothetical protein SS1G_09431 [Sclerotinia sclerotiorum 1980 UF-70]|uniref:Uncharacterized protein n=1 Tax=Sclerotinia sclerotiorum (strain ATCC 18683 / 1980 / Ss-1) TaxID=665079 RepID=A7EVS2_SCLS1|nr:hypothetical protein SS1G_09431 [Sclerotinia sclerotiorum 1980 UF-70]EDN93564.1 hypothetical protein SS1G_09431 [Sclerotinia sclerotiorum 1980 UF-70]
MNFWAIPATAASLSSAKNNFLAEEDVPGTKQTLLKYPAAASQGRMLNQLIPGPIPVFRRHQKELLLPSILRLHLKRSMFHPGWVSCRK